MQTDAPFDYWISDELKQHAIAQRPHNELTPTLRSLTEADFKRFQAQLEARTAQVRPSGRFTFKCGMGEGRGARGGERDRAGAAEDREVRDGRRVMTFDL